ncbi:PREDICTED: uncharacterized protein LOC109582771 [Amphimedon queenslandica]|nr:PREDICTED: uncharacterized protein LOC109582771 [Amphimedon queenslandica]|eukprot:XP_019853252.1 PREDICTED: uncharacterized protein LOC109582771 [Amphimedon queenslandica]
MVYKKKGRCRHDWYSNEDEAACGFKTKNGRRIFDSQGFCCSCSTSNNAYERGESKWCNRGSNPGHCLEFDPLYDFVFGLHPAQFVFNITIEIDKVSYSTLSGEEVYERLDTLVLSPTRRIRSSTDKTIRAEYIADFYPSDFIQVLNHKYLLVPDISNIETFPSDWVSDAIASGQLDSLYNMSEWLLVGKEHFALSGYHCNKIGVSYSAFTHQTDRCSNVFGSCLQGQPYHFWERDKERVKSGLKPLYMLHGFGEVHKNSYRINATDYQLNFIAQRIQRSLITISMQADNLRLVINKSPARILEAYIDSFEALSSTGLLQVYIQNIGFLTATYEVSVSHCSSGIDWISAKILTLDPGEQANVSFVVHSFNSLGQINNCEIQLLDQSAEVLDNLTIIFETLDTCFCYGYCGCSCGNNISDCPPPPEFQSPDQFSPIDFGLDYDFEGLNLEWLSDITDWFSSHFGALILFAIIAVVLILLGLAKVSLLIFAGQIALPAMNQCCGAMSRCVSLCCSAFCICCTKTALNTAWKASKLTSGKDTSRHVGQEDVVESGAQRPRTCDGMCSGAKKARRLHRKHLRMLKRQKAKDFEVTAWWEKPYTCTCVVKTTHDIMEIIKATFFFIYCPLLPLWWILEILFEWLMRKRRKQRRLKEYRRKKAEKQKKKEDTYLMVDDFSRGIKQKMVVDFEIKDENGKIIISDSESNQELGLDTDTTDTDEAGDIEELLDPNYPIHFNFAGATKETSPSSLKSPGVNFSIRGRLIKVEDKLYQFHLAEFTYQVRKQVKEKEVILPMPIKLKKKEFEKTMKEDLVQLLVTIKPLFICLNDKPQKKNKVYI